LNKKIQIVLSNPAYLATKDITISTSCVLAKCLKKHIDWTRLKQGGYANGTTMLSFTMKVDPASVIPVPIIDIAIATILGTLAYKEGVCINLYNNHASIISYHKPDRLPSYWIELLTIKIDESKAMVKVIMIHNPD
jgi:hypothetical protein